MKLGWMWPSAFATSDFANGFPSHIVNSDVVMPLLQSSANPGLFAAPVHSGNDSGEFGSDAAKISSSSTKQGASEIAATPDFAASSPVAGSGPEASSGEAEVDTLVDYGIQEGALTVVSIAALRGAGSEFAGRENAPLTAMGEQIGQADRGGMRWEKVNDPLKLAGSLSDEAPKTVQMQAGSQGEYGEQEKQAFSGSISRENSGDDLVATAEGPVEYQSLTGPTNAEKQAYVDMRYGMMIHYGINTYAGFDGHTWGGLGGGTRQIYDAPFGGTGENVAPNT